MSGGRLGGAPVHAVLFDYGMTLVTFRRPQAALLRAYDDIAALLTRRLGDPVPDGATLLAAVHDRVDAEAAAHEARRTTAELDITDAHRRAYAAVGLTLDDVLLDEVQRIEQRGWFSGIVVAPEVTATLDTLRAAGLRVGLCSNAPYRSASLREQLEHLGLAAHLDAVTLSSEVGWRKPSPRLFSAAVAALGADPASTVHVGDRMHEDVDGAHAAGLRAVLCREHHAEADPEGRADAVVDRISDLPLLLGVPGLG